MQAQDTAVSPMCICADIAGVQNVLLYNTGSSYDILSKECYNETIENPNFIGPTKLLPYKGKIPICANRN